VTYPLFLYGDIADAMMTIWVRNCTERRRQARLTACNNAYNRDRGLERAENRYKALQATNATRGTRDTAQTGDAILRDTKRLMRGTWGRPHPVPPSIYPDRPPRSK
jgi:uncharacterized protein YcgI (DUF1989 family)